MSRHAASPAPASSAGSAPAPAPGPAVPATAPADVRWLDPDEQAVWRAFLDVSRLLFEQLNRQLSDEAGMSLAEYEILVQLSEAPDWRLRMSELADRVVSSRSRITHTVGRMEERGLVHREACADDGRGVLCVLTEAGFARLEGAAPGHVETVRTIMFDPLGRAEAENLGAALTKVREKLRGC
jgi:DNA-binding MarR family transcriptional regulator